MKIIKLEDGRLALECSRLERLEILDLDRVCGIVLGTPRELLGKFDDKTLLEEIKHRLDNRILNIKG